jgi:GNAT superfamily N-acetyltransferase
VIYRQNNLLELDHHPVCAAKDASRLFLDRAATPPRRGGEIQLKAMNVVYREAEIADLAAIVEFQAAMARETEGITLDHQILTRGVCGVFEDRYRGQYLVAEQDGGVIASTLITYEWSDWRDGTVWWIQSVYVVPESRRRGVYAGLYKYVQELAGDDERVKGIRLYVDRRNVTAQTVYSNLGMNGEHYQVFEWMKEF